MPFAILALLFSAAAAAGSLYLGFTLGMRSCDLCDLQRAFALGLVGVLGVGLLAIPDRAARLCLLAVPLALGGLAAAGYQVYQGMATWPRANATWYLACPKGLGGIGTSAEQGLVAFTLTLFALLGGGAGEVRRTKQGVPALLAAWVLGLGVAIGALATNPPTPEPRGADPSKPLDTCRPTLR